MSNDKSAYLGKLQLDQFLGGVSPTIASSLYIALGAAATFAISTALTLNTYIIPITPNGRIYKVTTAGTTAGTEPTWPTTDGGTVTSGGATFTEQSIAIRSGIPSGLEVSGGGYARAAFVRNQTNFPASTTNGAGSATCTNGVAINFGAPSGPWGQVAIAFIMDAASAGNLGYKGTIAVPKSFDLGDTCTIAASGIVFTEA